jgi:hypothetical protein
MGAVKRLLTFVDLDDGHDPGPEARRMSVRALHEAVLADGRRVVLLNDRGWGGTLHTAWSSGPKPTAENRRRWERDSPGIWASQTVEQMQKEARDVVGPDGPEADDEAAHWAWMSSILREHGVEVAGAELQQLPHDVELSDRVLARIGHRRPDAPPPASDESAPA